MIFVRKIKRVHDKWIFVLNTRINQVRESFEKCNGTWSAYDSANLNFRALFFTFESYRYGGILSAAEIKFYSSLIDDLWATLDELRANIEEY